MEEGLVNVKKAQLYEWLNAKMFSMADFEESLRVDGIDDLTEEKYDKFLDYADDALWEYIWEENNVLEMLYKSWCESKNDKQ